MHTASDQGFVAYVGAPAMWIDDDPTVKPTQKVKRIKSAPFLGGAPHRLDESGYDFLTTVGNREQGSLLPQNFKGVSGGAVWNFGLVSMTQQRVRGNLEWIDSFWPASHFGQIGAIQTRHGSALLVRGRFAATF